MIVQKTNKAANQLFKSVVLFLFLGVFWIETAEAQQLFPAQPQTQDPRFVDEKLAASFYNNREWDKALPIYERLYRKYPGTQYYAYLFECMIQLRLYDDAERLARKAANSQNNQQATVDHAYIKQLKGQTQEANREYEALIKNLPPDRNIIHITANYFRARDLNDQAIMTYNYGASRPEINYSFDLEKAYVFQLTGNYPAMMDAYLSFMETNPEQIEMVKGRIQTLSFMDVDNNLAQIVREKILLKAQQHPNKIAFSELLIWYSLQGKDYSMALIQAKALDRRFGDEDRRILDISQACLNNDAFETALDGYSYLIRKGQSGLYLREAEAGSIQARYLIEIQRHESQITELIRISNDIEKVFATSGFNPSTYRLAFIRASIEAYDLNEAPKAIGLLEQALNLPLNQLDIAEIKMLLADIQLYAGDIWEATLLYSQIDKALKNEPIGHEARFRNARLRYFIGEFTWAQTQLDVLKAATSKLISNDAIQLSLLIGDALAADSTGFSLKEYARADLLIYQKRMPEAAQLLDSLSSSNHNQALVPHILLKKAELLKQNGKADEADQLLIQLFTGFSDHYLADDALYRSALINEAKAERQTALKRYERIVEKYPSSVFGATARQKYRMLRNENLKH